MFWKHLLDEVYFFNLCTRAVVNHFLFKLHTLLVIITNLRFWIKKVSHLDRFEWFLVECLLQNNDEHRNGAQSWCSWQELFLLHVLLSIAALHPQLSSAYPWITNELAFLKVHFSFGDNKNPGGFVSVCVFLTEHLCTSPCCNSSHCFFGMMGCVRQLQQI